jgi:hypothetical protein
MTEFDNNPLELGLERLVDWDLPDRASISLLALRKVKERGVSRMIKGVEVAGDPFPNLILREPRPHEAGAGEAGGRGRRAAEYAEVNTRRWSGVVPGRAGAPTPPKLAAPPR